MIFNQEIVLMLTLVYVLLVRRDQLTRRFFVKMTNIGTYQA